MRPAQQRDNRDGLLQWFRFFPVPGPAVQPSSTESLSSLCGLRLSALSVICCHIELNPGYPILQSSWS